MKPILITGINGFLASAIALDLLQSGYPVRGTLRSYSRRKLFPFLRQWEELYRAQLEIVEADLLHPSIWDQTIQGVDLILHVARVSHDKYTQSLPAKAQDELDVMSSLHVLQAAQRQGIRKVVRTLGSITFLPDDPAQAMSEETTLNKDHFAKSALREEAALWDFSARYAASIAVTTLHPTLIFGPRLATKHQLSLMILEDFMQRRLEGCPTPEIYLPIVDVANVVQAHTRALFDPTTDGKRYLLAPRESFPVTRMIETLNEVSNLKLNTQKTLDTEKLTQLARGGNRTAAYLLFFQTWPRNYLNDLSVSELKLDYLSPEESISRAVQQIIKEP